MVTREQLRDTRLTVFEGVLEGSLFRDDNGLNSLTPYEGEEHYTRSITTACNRIAKILNMDVAKAPDYIVACFADMNPSCMFQDMEGIEQQKGSLKTLLWIENVLLWHVNSTSQGQ